MNVALLAVLAIAKALSAREVLRGKDAAWDLLATCWHGLPSSSIDAR